MGSVLQGDPLSSLRPSNHLGEDHTTFEKSRDLKLGQVGDAITTRVVLDASGIMGESVYQRLGPLFLLSKAMG